jgi:hypothetical protein
VRLACLTSETTERISIMSGPALECVRRIYLWRVLVVHPSFSWIKTTTVPFDTQIVFGPGVINTLKAVPVIEST